MSVKRLDRFKGKRSLSVVLFGFSGNGKSSMINTLHSLQGSMVEIYADVRNEGQLDQCTLEFEEYPIGDRVSVFDTWGLRHDNEDGENYLKKDFESMLDGQLRPGMTEETVRILRKEQHSIIDVVVFVLDPKDLLIKEGSEESKLEKIKPFYDSAKKMDRRCMIVTTMMDKWAKKKLGLNLLEKVGELKMKEARATLINSDVWKKEIQTPVTKILDDRIAVIPIINYESIDVEKKDVITFFGEKFVQLLTHVPRKRNGRKSRARVKEVSFSVDLFEKETPVDLVYLKETEHVQTPIHEVNISESVFDNPENKVRGDARYYVFPKVMFRVLKMGSDCFRFFVASTLMTPGELLVGLFHQDGMNISYFESASKDPELFQKLEEAFSEKYQGSYEFVTSYEVGGKTSSTTYEIDSRVKMVHLHLLKGEVHIILKRTKFPQYAGEVEGHIQMIKKNTLNEVKTCEMVKKFEQITKKYDGEFGVAKGRLESEITSMSSSMEEQEEKRKLEIIQFKEELDEKLGKGHSSLDEFKEKMDLESKLEMMKLKKDMQDKLSSDGKKISDDVGKSVAELEKDISSRMERRCKGCENKMLDLRNEVLVQFEEEKRKFKMMDEKTVEMVLGSRPKLLTSAFYQAMNSTNYIVWQFEENSCRMHPDTSIAQYAYKLPRGTYLILWKSTWAATVNQQMRLYKGGALLDISYKCDSHGYNQSPMIMKVVEMNGTSDNLRFYLNSGSNATNYYHSLVVLKLQDPRSDTISQLGEISVWRTSADYHGVNGNHMLWRTVHNGLNLQLQNTNQYKLPKGKYLLLWKCTLQNGNGQYISLEKTGTQIDISYCSSCSGNHYCSPCIMKIVEMNGTTDYLRFVKTCAQNTTVNAHSLEILKIYDEKNLPRFGVIPLQTTSCIRSGNNGNYVLWNVIQDTNGCGIFVQNTNQYKFPSGVYLILWKSTYQQASRQMTLYKNGTVIDYSHEGSCNNQLHSPTICRVVQMNGFTDYLRFMFNNAPYNSNVAHSLEIIKLREY